DFAASAARDADRQIRCEPGERKGSESEECGGGPLIGTDKLDVPLPFLTDLRACAQGFIIEALVEPGDRIFAGRFVPTLPEPLATHATSQRPRDRQRNCDGEPDSEGKLHPNLLRSCLPRRRGRRQVPCRQQAAPGAHSCSARWRTGNEGGSCSPWADRLDWGSRPPPVCAAGLSFRGRAPRRAACAYRDGAEHGTARRPPRAPPAGRDTSLRSDAPCGVRPRDCG